MVKDEGADTTTRVRVFDLSGAGQRWHEESAS